MLNTFLPFEALQVCWNGQVKPNNFTPGNGFFIAQGLETMETPNKKRTGCSLPLRWILWFKPLIRLPERVSVYVWQPFQTRPLAEIMDFSSNKCCARRCWYLSKTGNATANRQAHRMDYANQNKPWHDDDCHMFYWQNVQMEQTTWKGHSRKSNRDEVYTVCASFIDFLICSWKTILSESDSVKKKKNLSFCCSRTHLKHWRELKRKFLCKQHLELEGGKGGKGVEMPFFFCHNRELKKRSCGKAGPLNLVHCAHR